MADQTNSMGIPFEWPSFTKTYHHKAYAHISPSRPEIASAIAGKHVVVTGGGTGIGKAVAIAYAQAGAASVSIIGRRADRLTSAAHEIRAASTSSSTLVLTEVADLTQRADVEGAFEAILATVHAPIDILVSNAGMLPTMKPFVGYDTDKLMRSFGLNVLSSFNAIQAWMARAPATGATLINISTSAAHIAPLPGMFAYAASKAAALKMVDYVAVENPDIHVVSVQPGVVDTEIGMGERPDDFQAQDEPELPGQFCVWLASPEAAFLRGKFVWANWDVEEMLARKDQIASSKLLTWKLEGVVL